MARIGIEAGDTVRRHRAGMARYTYELIEALIDLRSPHQLTALLPVRRLPGIPFKPRRPHARWYRRGRAVSGFDLIHATCCTFPGPRRSAEVATLHDLFTLTGPGQDPSPEKIEETTRYLRRADRVICVSASAQSDLHRMTDLDESMSVVIPLGVNPEFRPRSDREMTAIKQRLGLPQDFLLFVGRPRPNKNLTRLIEAYAESGVDLPLVLAGRFGRRHNAELMEAATRSGVADRLRLPGFVRETDLPALLSGATGFLFPSLFEGFGLPVLEALACGAPVLTSLGVATEEVAGGHAVLVDPRSIDDMSDGINRLIGTSDTDRDARSTFARAFTWERTAARTLEVYEDVLGG